MRTRITRSRRNVAGPALAGLLMIVAFAPVARAATATAPCTSNSQTRQLDYWLGNWRVGGEGASTAHSTVSLALDKCLVVENWDAGSGHTGRNIFGYSVDDKSWYGMFADNEGRVHIFTSGTVASGSAEFQGTSLGPNGERVLNRVKLVRLSPDKVEQTWEKSNNNGVSWKLAFRGEYSRSAQ